MKLALLVVLFIAFPPVQGDEITIRCVQKPLTHVHNSIVLYKVPNLKLMLPPPIK